MLLKIQRNHANTKTWNFQLQKRGKWKEGQTVQGGGFSRPGRSLDCLGGAFAGLSWALAVMRRPLQFPPAEISIDKQ